MSPLWEVVLGRGHNFDFLQLSRQTVAEGFSCRIAAPQRWAYSLGIRVLEV